MPKRGENQKTAAPFDLKAVRERLSMTQKQMAELLESGQSSIARWETEGSLPLIYRKFLGVYEEHVHGRPTTKRRDRRRANVPTKTESRKSKEAALA